MPAAPSITSSSLPTVPQGTDRTRTVTATGSGDRPADDTPIREWSGWFDHLGTVWMATPLATGSTHLLAAADVGRRPEVGVSSRRRCPG